MADTMEMCHCGEPLHYTNPLTRVMVQELVDSLGEFIEVYVDGMGVWKVQRHYIALHGVKGHEIPGLGFEQIAISCPKCGMTSHNKNDIEQKYCGNCHQFHRFLG